MNKSYCTKKTCFLPVIGIITINTILIFSLTYEPTWNFDWKHIRKEIRDSVRLIQQNGGVSCGLVGDKAITPQQWYRRIWLIINVQNAHFHIKTDTVSI